MIAADDAEALPHNGANVINELQIFIYDAGVHGNSHLAVSFLCT
jgi:hypothetical protein